MNRGVRAILRLDAMAERDNQPRLFVFPRNADGHWLFTDTHVLFRFPHIGHELTSFHPDQYVDLGRWLRVRPEKDRGILDGAGRCGWRLGRTANVWRALAGDLDSEASRWGEQGLEVVRFRPRNVAVNAQPLNVCINSRLFRLALMPARADEVVICDLAADGPVWLHGRDWSAAVAPLRGLGKLRSEQVVDQDCSF